MQSSFLWWCKADGVLVLSRPIPCVQKQLRREMQGRRVGDVGSRTMWMTGVVRQEWDVVV